MSRPDLTIIDEGLPLLEGISGLLRALRCALAHDVLDGEHSSAAVAVITEQVDYVVNLLHRWQAHGEVG